MEQVTQEGKEVFKTQSATFYAINPEMRHMVGLAIEHRASQVDDKNFTGQVVGLVSVPTHVLQLLGHNFIEITAENPVVIAMRVDGLDVAKDDMLYGAAFIVVHEVTEHWSFGRVFPVTDTYIGDMPNLVKADKNVLSPADFMEMPATDKPISVASGKDRRHLYFTEQGKETQQLEILGPGAFKLPIKIKLDRMSPRNLETHMRFLQGLDVTVRQDRRIAREFVTCGALEKNYQEAARLSPDPLSHEEYMASLINMDLSMLTDFEKMDSLPDDEYIEAVRGLLEADAQLTWKLQREEGDTDLDFIPWVEQYTGRPFLEIHHNFLSKEFPEQFKASEAEESDEDVMEAPPADIAVTVLGTIFERPIDEKTVGIENPFAIDTLKALQNNGHRIILVTGDMDEATTEKIVDILAERGFTADAVNHTLPNDLNRGMNLQDLSLAGIACDMTIDYRNCGMQLHEIVNHDAKCLFWPPVTSWFQANGYITMEDVQAILARLQETEE